MNVICLTFNVECAKPCFIKNYMGKTSNVFSARENVSFHMVKGDFVAIEKTGKENYTLWFTGIPQLSISAPLKKLPSTISFQGISGFASPVRTATSGVNIAKTGISPKRASKN